MRRARSLVGSVGSCREHSRGIETATELVIGNRQRIGSVRSSLGRWAASAAPHVRKSCLTRRRRVLLRDAKPPHPPAPLPLSTGGEGRKTPARRPIQAWEV